MPWTMAASAARWFSSTSRMSTAWSSVSRHGLVQEAHQREVPARGRHLAHPVGRGGSNAVEQDPLIVAVDPADVDFQHPGRLDHFQPRQKPLHATDRRVRRAGLDVVQRRMRIVVADLPGVDPLLAGSRQEEPWEIANTARPSSHARGGRHRGSRQHPGRRRPTLEPDPRDSVRPGPPGSGRPHTDGAGTRCRADGRPTVERTGGERGGGQG